MMILHHLSEGNSDAIKQASTEFEAVDSAVQSLLKNSGMSEYADQFTEVKMELPIRKRENENV